MPIPISRMQASGRFHVPGVREPVTGYHVRQALDLLDPAERMAVEGYLTANGEGKLPPQATLRALREAVVETVQNGKRICPEGQTRSH
jgi:hypothetical protein